MKKLSIKRVIAFAAALVISLFPLKNVEAAASDGYWPSGIKIADSEETAFVLEEETGTVLYDCRGDEKHYPASITKVLTALIAIENGNLNDIVTYSKDAIYKVELGSSSIGRDVGEQMTLEQCLYALMLESCNNTAYAIAEHIGGTFDNFINMMNAKAASLGCVNSHFANPHGLPDENHYTTAHDMALIAREAFKHEEFRRFCGTGKYTIPPTNKHADNTYLRNHHGMLYPYRTSDYLYEYCKGGKTGYTQLARNTLVTFAEKDGLTLVCVIMHAGASQHYKDTTALFNYCFDNFVAAPITDTEDVFGTQELSAKGVLAAGSPPLMVESGGICVLPKNVSFSETERSLVVTPSETDPDQAGLLKYTYGGRDVGFATVKYSGEGILNQQGLPGGEIAQTVLGSGMEEKPDEVIKIDPKTIVLIAVAAAAVVVLITLLVIRAKSPVSQRKRKTHYSGKRSSSGYREIKNRLGGPAERVKGRRKSHDFTSTDIHSDNFIKK